MNERRNQADELNISQLRERIVKLEVNLQYLQETITTLRNGQAENRAFTERRFNEVIETQTQLKQEIADLKLAVAARTVPTANQNRIYYLTLAIGFSVGALIIVLLMLWVRLGTIGVHF